MDNFVGMQVGRWASGVPADRLLGIDENAQFWMAVWIRNECEDIRDRNALQILFAVTNCTVSGLKTANKPVLSDFDDPAHLLEVYQACKTKLAPWVEERGRATNK
jgi:hypothetical protein